MTEQDRRASKRVTVYRAEVPGSDAVWEVEYEAIADALHFACRDLREGRRTPICILEDGVLMYDRETIVRVCNDENTAHPTAADERNGEA